MEWTVICEPVSNRSDDTVRNRGGLRVLLTDGEHEHEICRVGYARQNTRNPDESFEERLQKELDKAYEAATTVNELQSELEAAREEAYRKARDRIREVLGNPSRALV